MAKIIGGRLNIIGRKVTKSERGRTGEGARLSTALSVFYQPRQSFLAVIEHGEVAAGEAAQGLTELRR